MDFDRATPAYLCCKQRRWRGAGARHPCQCTAAKCQSTQSSTKSSPRPCTNARVPVILRPMGVDRSFWCEFQPEEIPSQWELARLMSGMFIPLRIMMESRLHFDRVVRMRFVSLQALCLAPQCHHLRSLRRNGRLQLHRSCLQVTPHSRIPARSKRASSATRNPPLWASNTQAISLHSSAPSVPS